MNYNSSNLTGFSKYEQNIQIQFLQFK
uniref:Uncharacterized protein n=1 Tax=Arundo donax TaxID=35708 RepID=A0A0A9BEG8_ARUDO